MNPISLCMIVKNSEDNLKRLLPSIKDYFSEIIIVDTGSDDNSKKIAKDNGAKVYDFEWINDFSAARNFSFSKATNEWVMWLDDDDEVFGLDNLENIIKNQKIDAYAFRYDYAHDEAGNCIAVQWRERLVKKDLFEWRGKIHETCIQKSKALVVQYDDIYVKHLATKEQLMASNRRNLDMLVDEYNKNRDMTDPRTLFYIAQTYKGLKEWELASKFYTLYIPKSGWEEEKMVAWHSLADCMRFMGKFNEAIIADHETLKIQPDWPDGYIGLGDTYFYMADQCNDKESWKKAIEWYRAGFSKKIPDVIRVVEPHRYTWMPLMNMSICQLWIGDVEEAYDNYMRAYKLSGGNEYVSRHYQLFDELKSKDKAIQGFLEYIEYMNKNDKKTLRNIDKMVTHKLMDDPRMIEVVNMFSTPKVWGEKEIVIFCPFAYEDWAAPSVSKGIGGSEEAVIYLSKEFVKLGYNVTVFNSCGALAGEYDGVVYKNTWEMNPKDTYNIFISWRNPYTFKHIKAKHKWVWLHDVPLNAEEEYKPEVVASFDKVVVLSEFHRSLIPMVPDKKILVSNNGIVPEQFKSIDKKPFSIFYGSSYDRGLECLLRDIYPIIKKEVPEATLNVCYGWDTFLKMNESNPSAMEWKSKVDELLKQDGVIHHGRVSHRRVAELMGESIVWAYPTEFEEINCITLQKAQCAGCVAVTTDVAALPERNLTGVMIKHGKKIYSSINLQKEFAKEVVNQLKNPKKIDVEMCKKKFAWSETAKQWVKEWK